MRRTVFGNLLVLLCLLLSLGVPPLWAGEEDFLEGTYAGRPLFLKDGRYEGTCFFITVSVGVEGGRVSEIRILHHGNGGKQYEAMVEPLIGEMLRRQSTAVDAVTGATISSENLRRAVVEALLQSAGKKGR